MSELVNDGYGRALEWLERRPNFETRSPGEQAAMRLPLERPAALLEALGRPDQAYPSFLVAGTKGKGSTATFIAEILRAHGLRVGLYSQPHLHTQRERLRIDDELIAPGELAGSIERVRPRVEALDAMRSELGPCTAYEILTAVGLDWFARRAVDWAVLEVGLGGRLDATNVVTPAVAVITPISYDHMHILGRKLAEIAAEKAGIIKPGGAVVSAPQRPSAQAVIRRTARSRGALLTVVGACPGTPTATNVRPLRLAADAPRAPDRPMIRFDIEGGAWRPRDVELHLGGQHQVTNALTALAAVEAAGPSGLRIEPEATRRGLAAARWPGRFEIVQTAPVVVLDGAHNGDSAERLREALEVHFEYEQLHLVLGVFADKDLGAILRPFRGAAGLTAVSAGGPRARPASQVARAARRLGIAADEAVSVEAGLAAALSTAGRRSVVCVTGSLQVVARAREALGLAVREE